jgi:outer membrane protein
MRKKIPGVRLPLAAALMLGALSGSLMGQTPQTVTLTLDQAIATAIRNHPQIAIAQNLASAAGQRVTETRSADYPFVSGAITGSQSNDPNARIGAGAINASRIFSRNGEGIQVNQLITDFGRTHNLVASSRLQQQAQQQNALATRYDVALGVARAYYEVLQNTALVRVADETVHARQTLTDQVSALATAQLRSQVDVSFAQVNLSEAQLLLIRARDSVKQAYADLARAMGEDRPPVAYQLTEAPAAPTPSTDPEALVAEAIQNRPDLSELRLRYQAAQRFEQAERDLKRPVFSFAALAGSLPYIDQDPRTAPDFYEGAALNLQIPIFNGHLFSARGREAYYQSLAANQRLRDLQQQIEHDVRTALLTAQNAYERIPVTERLLDQARLALNLAQGRYNLALASIVELTQAQLNVTQAEIENTSARYDYQEAWAALQYSIGALR